MTTEEAFLEKWKTLETVTRLAFPTWDGREIEKFLKCMRVDGVDFTRLKALRDVRNALSHTPMMDGAPLVRLNDGTIPFLDSLTGRMRRLPTAANICIPFKNVYHASLNDTIASVVDVMLANVYSHVPVLDADGRVVGVFSESTLLEMNKAGMTSRNETALKDIAQLLPSERHKAEVFRFVPQCDPVAHLRSLFAEALEEHERIGMIFVTETGIEDEPLLGILTVWDVAGVSDFKKHSTCQTVPQVKCSTMGTEKDDEMSNEGNECKKNKRLLKAEYPDFKEEDILPDTIVKQNSPTIHIYDIEPVGTNIVECPFKGTYIEVEFDQEVVQNVLENFEQKIQHDIEAFIHQKLSCTRSLKMSGYKKIVYRIAYEMQGR